jgi:hypothetical protein
MREKHFDDFSLTTLQEGNTMWRSNWTTWADNYQQDGVQLQCKRPQTRDSCPGRIEEGKTYEIPMLCDQVLHVAG